MSKEESIKTLYHEMMYKYSVFTLKVSIDQGFLLTARVTQDKCHNLRFESVPNIVKTTTKFR